MFGTLGTSSIGADTATVQNAISLLAAVSDPEAAKAVLDQLAGGLAEMKQREAAAAAAEAKNAERLAGLVETEGRSKGARPSWMRVRATWRRISSGLMWRRALWPSVRQKSRRARRPHPRLRPSLSGMPRPWRPRSRPTGRRWRARHAG